MKPINEMNLQECLASIRRGDYLNRHHLADRIEELTSELTSELDKWKRWYKEYTSACK